MLWCGGRSKIASDFRLWVRRAEKTAESVGGSLYDGINHNLNVCTVQWIWDGPDTMVLQFLSVTGAVMSVVEVPVNTVVRACTVSIVLSASTFSERCRLQLQLNYLLVLQVVVLV